MRGGHPGEEESRKSKKEIKKSRKNEQTLRGRGKNVRRINLYLNPERSQVLNGHGKKTSEDEERVSDKVMVARERTMFSKAPDYSIGRGKISGDTAAERKQ